MTYEELAAELFELIVVKGRGVRDNSVMGTTYAELPEWMQEMWLEQAHKFADQNSMHKVTS